MSVLFSIALTALRWNENTRLSCYNYIAFYQKLFDQFLVDCHFARPFDVGNENSVNILWQMFSIWRTANTEQWTQAHIGRILLDLSSYSPINYYK